MTTQPTPAALLPQRRHHLDAATISLTDLLKSSWLWGPAPPVNTALTLKFVKQESPASTIFTKNALSRIVTRNLTFLINVYLVKKSYTPSSYKVLISLQRSTEV